MAFSISPKVSLWLGFVFTLLLSTMTSFQVSFNALALPLKEQFNLTQTQVEIIASLGAVGYGAGFLESILTRVLGFKVTCVIAGFGMTASGGLYSLAAYCWKFFHTWPYLIYLIHFCLCATNRIAYYAVTKICVQNFPKTNTGKIIGMYLAFAAMGKIIFAGLIEFFFRDNISGFFLFLSLVTLLLYLVCSGLLLPISTDRARPTDGSETEALQTETSPAQATDNANAMLKSPFFHVIFWSSVTFYAFGLTSVNNATTIAQSVGVQNTVHIVCILAVVIIIVRVVFGLLFDTFLTHWSGYALLITSYCSFMASMVIGVFFLDTSTIIIATVFTGLGMSAGMITPVSIILWRFGRTHYSALSGYFYAVVSVVQILMQIALGFLYDSKKSELGLSGTTCYGKECFFWAFCIMLAVTLIISIAQTLNFLLTAKHHNK